VLLEAFREFEPLYTAAGFAATTPPGADIAPRLSEGPTWIAEEDHAIVGTVSAVDRGDEIHVRSMAVLPPARGRGVARQLLDCVYRFAASCGRSRLTLSTTPFLHAAIELYERAGFRRTTEPLDLFGTPLIGMVKVLSRSSDTERLLATNRAGWNQVAPKFHGATALPEYGPLAPTEDSLRLLEIVPGMRVLELGCGSGHSLRYLAERGAAELWGLDFSPVQIGFAAELLRPYATSCRLVESPMEMNPGIPTGHFDLVFSLYGMGWTTDLPATLSLVARYLRPGGVFIVSGEHPSFSRVEWDGTRLVVSKPYVEEGAHEHISWKGVPIVIQHRTLGTWISEIGRAGLHVERLIETPLDTSAANEAHADPERWYSVARARLIPTTFIIKARLPGR
jgi:SAM-dependent methyltransferase/GNAT superfamily N-acetyltransferase